MSKTGGVSAGACLVALLGGACAPNTCCPEGPPYAFSCSESYYYYFHGNQIQAAPVASTILTESPWRHTGRVRRGSGGGTGVLIHPEFVLTAAHVVTSGGELDEEPWISFQLAQPCADCLPYGTRVASRVWVPQEWVDSVGGSYDSEETRAYDWALLQVDLDPSLWVDGVPEPLPMPVSNQVYTAFDDLTPRAAGYACGQQATGSTRRVGQPYATDGSGAFLGQEAFPAVGGAGGGALYRTSLEGTAGMSGGPVWVEQNGEPVLVGVLIGSPQEACDQGENWVAGLSITTRQRITQVIATGTAPGMVSAAPQGGGGGADDCPGLFSFQGPCDALSGGGDPDCGNPEDGD